MTVGFVMLAHTALHRAAQVIRVLSKQGCPVVVHIDRRTPKNEFDAFAQSISDLPNVQLAPRRRCEWGTWSLVEVSRDAATTLLENPEVSHVCLISGACLPIKPMTALREMLARAPNTDFVESVKIEEVPWTQGGLSHERFTFSFPFAWKRRRRLFDLWVEVQRALGRRRRVPDGVDPHMGSQWWCLTRATLETILNDPRRKQLDRYFRRVWIPDESYFQTLVRLYDRQVESVSPTLSKFDYKGKPHVFYDDHLILLRQTQAIFARKIWPGANRLYRAFLAVEAEGIPARPSTQVHIDRAFAQAVTRRTRGRPGLIMSSRYPVDPRERVQTAEPYTVFQGHDALFPGFARWAEAETGWQTHGHLFDPKGAQFRGGSAIYAGCLSSNAALRDYDPAAFLRNLIWNMKGSPQALLFGPGDQQDITSFFVQDPNANIHVITGAWAIPLFLSGKSVLDVRSHAARLQTREAAFLELINRRDSRARVCTWNLGEVLEAPSLVLSPISSGPSYPNMVTLSGFSEFLQRLRNAGMNPYLVGEVAEMAPSGAAPVAVAR